MKKLLSLSIILLSWAYTMAQNTDNQSTKEHLEFQLLLGVNQYIPFSHFFVVNTIPPFWYNFEEGEVRIGGQTLGLNLYKNLSKDWVYIGQAHLKSQRFLFGELTFTDQNGEPIGTASVTHQEFALKHASLFGKQTNNNTFAFGIGVDSYLASYGVLNRRDIAGTNIERRMDFSELYKDFSPFVSCLFVQQYDRWSLNIQADYAFLSRYKLVVDNAPKPTYLSIMVGVGFKIS